MNATWFRRLTTPRGVPIEWDRDAFLHFLAVVGEGTVKDALPLWSPARFADDRRSLANVRSVGAVVLDVDTPRADVATFARELADAIPETGFAYHTSFSSVPGSLRLRAIVFLARPVTSAEYRLVWAVVARLLASHAVHVDAQCKDASRAYFVPTIPPSGVYEWGYAPGEPLDVDFAIGCERARQAHEDHARATEAARLRDRVARGDAGDVAKRAASWLLSVPGAISGAGGHVHTFKTALALVSGFCIDEGLAYELLAVWNRTCLPPWSERDLRRKIRQAIERGRLRRGYLLDRGAA